MTPRIELLAKKKLVGKSMHMTLEHNRTFELWKSFMPHTYEIKNSVSPNLYSIQIYNNVISFQDFNPKTEFTKWAAIEISEHDESPNHLECFFLNGGLYAVFVHKGPTKEFQNTINYIFNEWLPKSIYQIDQRAHFEILGEKYKNNDPTSEEEVWIPIKKRTD